MIATDLISKYEKDDYTKKFNKFEKDKYVYYVLDT